MVRRISVQQHRFVLRIDDGDQEEEEKAGLPSHFLTFWCPHAPAAFTQQVRSMTSSQEKERALVRIAREDATTRKLGANQGSTVTPLSIISIAKPSKEASIKSQGLMSYMCISEIGI